MTQLSSSAGFRGIWTDGRADGSAPYSLEAIVTIARSKRVRGLVAGEREALLVSSTAARELNLPAIPEVAAIALTSRAALRDRLTDVGLPQPEYRIVWSPEEAVEATAALGTPVYVSCADSFTGEGERRVEHVEDVSLACARAAKGRAGDPIVLEKDVAEDSYSVFGFLDDGVLNTTGIAHAIRATPFRFARGLSFPALLQVPTRKRLTEVCGRALNAVGLNRGGARVEVIVSGDEVQIVDIDVCPFSSWMPEDLIGFCGGQSYLEGCLSFASGKNPDTGNQFTGGAAIQWIPARSGKVEGVLGIERARNVYGVVNLKIAVAPGDVIGHVVDALSRDRVGYAFATGSDAASAEEAARSAVDLCDVAARAVFDAS